MKRRRQQIKIAKVHRKKNPANVLVLICNFPLQNTRVSNKIYNLFDRKECFIISQNKDGYTAKTIAIEYLDISLN